MTRLVGLLVFVALFHVSFGARCHKDVKPKPKPDDSGRTKPSKPKDNSWSHEKPDDSCLTRPRKPEDNAAREQPDRDCPPGWEKRTFCGRRAHSCYKKIKFSKGSKYFWRDSNNPCAKYHPDAQLTSIHCLEEDNFIRNTYGPTTIGMHNQRYWSRNKFHWIDGTDTKYTNWGPNQPDNLYIGEYNVQIAGPGTGGHWRDDKNANSVSGVCKIEFTRLHKYSPALYPCEYGFKFWSSCGLPKCLALVEERRGWSNQCGNHYHPNSHNVKSTCDDHTSYFNTYQWTPIRTKVPSFSKYTWTLSLCEAPILYTSPASSSCPEGWTPGDFCGGSACYKTYLIPLAKGLDGVKRIISNGMHCSIYNPKANVASIHCREEDDFMQRFSYSFIGLHLPSTGNPKKWVDGTPFDYNGFDKGTLNSRSSNQEFVSIEPGKGWGVYPVTVPEQMVCKIVLRPYKPSTC